MRKLYIIILLIAAVITPAKAGDGDKHVGFQAGLLYPGVLNGLHWASRPDMNMYGHSRTTCSLFSNRRTS